MSDAAWLQTFFTQEIPLSAAMGLEVSELNARSIRINAPLAPNRNDKGTAFGGSLASLLTLAGWGLIYSRLQGLEMQADVVIHTSKILYRAPITQDIWVHCELPHEDIWDSFIANLNQQRRARIQLTSRATDATTEAATMEARYVAILR